MFFWLCLTGTFFWGCEAFWDATLGFGGLTAGRGGSSPLKGRRTILILPVSSAAAILAA